MTRAPNLQLQLGLSQESPHQFGTNLQMAEDSDEDETVEVLRPELTHLQWYHSPLTGDTFLE